MVIIKKSNIGQFEKGVFADRDYKTGETVIEYNLKELTEEEYENLPEEEKTYAHEQNGSIFLYLEPERYVNHSDDPNTIQDFENGRDIAIRDIKEGEEITTDTTKEDY